jgi:septal ring factor EnvC (AmiA/AmiB activator)
MRVFLFLFLFLTLLDAKEDINKQIKNTNNEISSFSKTYSSINKKMAQNAKAILQQKRAILKQKKYLQELQVELKEKEKVYKENTKQLSLLKKKQKKLAKIQSKIEEELIFEIAQSISFSIILEGEYTANSDSLMEFEILQSMLKTSKEKANKLNYEFYKNSKDIDLLNIHASSLEVVISNIDTKRKNLISAQKKKKKALKKLKLAKGSYKKELKKILKKQDTLKKTLAQLNIIKIDEINKINEEKRRREAFASKETKSIKRLPKVKRHGSSYQAVKTKRYTGPKTIAPINAYTITKKYGTYTDPIYGIKIFNESISLKPKKANAKVKTVFNGKVIYADKTAVLDNIVIIEHKNGVHTIYANLSKISPNIRKGKKIKKGYTIGRISDELIFEVTQKSYHINPIRLFQ